MSDILKTLCAVALIACAVPAIAQDTPEQTEEETPEQTEPTTEGTKPSLDMGEDVTNEIRPGDKFFAKEFNDWKIRCTRLPSGGDACEMHQLLKDQSGNPVAELNILPLIKGQTPARALVNFMAPLDTFLKEGVTLSVDSGKARRFQFVRCFKIGCLAQFGIDENYVNDLKNGGKALIRIVPAVATDQQVNLEVSLNGFTAAFNALDKSKPEPQAPTRPVIQSPIPN